MLDIKCYSSSGRAFLRRSTPFFYAAIFMFLLTFLKNGRPVRASMTCIERLDYFIFSFIDSTYIDYCPSWYHLRWSGVHVFNFISNRKLGQLDKYHAFWNWSREARSMAVLTIPPRKWLRGPKSAFFRFHSISCTCVNRRAKSSEDKW